MRGINGWVAAMGLWLGVGSGGASADVLRVPSQYPTIQAAIDAAVDGDEIEVADSFQYYREPIVIENKALRILGDDDLSNTASINYSGTEIPYLFHIESGHDKEVVFENLEIRWPSGNPNTLSTARIIDSRVRFINCFLFGGGHRPGEQLRLENSNVIVENTLPAYCSGLSCYMDSSELALLGGLYRGDVRLYKKPGTDSEVIARGVRFNNMRRLGSGSADASHPSDSAPSLTIEDCTFESTASSYIVGTWEPGSWLRVIDSIHLNPSNGLIHFDVIADGADVEIRRSEIGISPVIVYAHRPPVFHIKNGATLKLVQTDLLRLRASAHANPTFARFDGGSLEIVDSRLLPFPGEAGAVRLVDGSLERLVVRDSELPPVRRVSNGVDPCLFDLQCDEALMQHVTVLSQDDGEEDQAAPLVRLILTGDTPLEVEEIHDIRLDVTGGDVRVHNCDLLGLEASGEDVQLQSLMVHAGGVVMRDADAMLRNVEIIGGGMELHDSTVSVLESRVEGGIEAYDSSLTMIDIPVVGGETGLYAERSVIDIQGGVFESVNRESTQPPRGGVIIAHDSEVTVRDLAVIGCAVGTNGPPTYPQGTSPAVFGFSGASRATITSTAIHDAYVNSRGLVHARDTADILLTNCTLTASRSDSGPLLATSASSVPVRFVQCLVVGNEADDRNTPNPRSLVLAQAGALVRFEQCTIWGNTVLGNPFKGAVEFENSLVEGVTPYDPLFTRYPDDGGDRWYNSRTDTPGFDDAANNDYGDLRLLPGSPAIDAGDATALPPDTADLDADGDTTEPLPLDLAGNPRVVDDPATSDTGIGGPLDLGVYEYQPAACPGDCDANGVVNADDIPCFVAGFLGQTPEGDCNADALWTLDDIECFAAGFLAGCP